MKYQRGFTLADGGVVFTMLLIMAGGIGWVWNILKIVDSDFATITGLLVIRCIGIIIAPVGAIVGYV